MPNPSYLALSSMQGQILCSQQLTTTSATSVYTVPASTTVKIAHGVVCNTGGSAVTITVSLVPSGGTADGTHRVISTYSLAAGDSLSLGDYIGGAMLGPGDFISVQAGTANVVNVVITGAVSS